MTVLAGLYLWVVGLCVGSFLNVVVYRLPAGLSVTAPRWSMCPRCRRTLHWIENIPIFSWFAQRGRCRGCGQGVSAQYPLVEAATGLAFVLVYVLIVPLAAHFQVDSFVFPGDVALLLAWLVLTAALLAGSAMDIVSYMIDLRITDVATYAGVLLAMFWMRPEVTAPAAAPAWAAGAAVATLIVFAQLHWPRGARDASEDAAPSAAGEADGTAAATGMGPGSAAWVLVLLGLSVAGLLLAVEPGEVPAWAIPAALLGGLFLTVVGAAARQRAADEEVVAAVDEEAAGARRAVLGELVWLAPGVVAGVLVALLLGAVPALGAAWTGLVHWAPLAGLTPVAGLGWSLAGIAVAAGVGWAVRIVFTLAFGREAFGVGDIVVLAAAGATVGWKLAVLGFVAAVGVALLGWILSLPLKRAVMMPFVPSLALGFPIALWLSRPAAELFGVYTETIAAAWVQRPGLLLGFGAVTLVVGVAAVLLAKLLRRWLEPAEGSIVRGESGE